MEDTANPTNPENQEKKDDFKEKMGSASETGKPNSQDNAEGKTAEEKNPPENAAKTEPPQEHDWKKRYDGTAADLKRKSEEHDRIIDAQVKLAQKKPAYLNDLVETDPNLADQVVKKAFGHDSYESYQKSLEIEELKDVDPGQYETQKRLAVLEAKEKERISVIKESFYKEKGISTNTYDPSHQNVETQLNLLDKNFVDLNLTRAMEMAYNLAFPGGKKEVTVADKHLADQTANSGGSSSTEIPSGKTGRFSNAAARAFNEKFNS